MPPATNVMQISAFSGLSLLLGIGLMLAGLFFFGVLFHPWMLAHCTASEAHSDKAKAYWLGVMAVLGPLGSFLYGLLATRGIWIRLICAGFLFLGWFVFILFNQFFYEAAFRNAEANKAVMAKLNQAKLIHLSAESRTEVKNNLEELLKVQGSAWYDVLHYREKEKANLLFLKISLMLRDNTLTYAEFQDWTRSYQTRKDSGAKDALTASVRALRTAPLAGDE